MRRIRRRTFLTRTAGLGLGALAAPAVVSAAGQVLGANDKIRMGIIGSGGRGRNVMKTHQGLGTEFIGVCDIFKKNLYEGLKAAGERAQPYADYRKLLEAKDIDAVLIGTPEHWHGPMLIDAVAAGKDAYCELTNSGEVTMSMSASAAISAARNADGSLPAMK